MSAVAGARRVGLLEAGADAPAPAPRFSWTGNVMKSDLLRETFIAEVLRAVPAAVLAPPVAEPVDGVALLEHVPAESPLVPAIHSATR